MTIINGGLGGKGRHLKNMIKHLTRLDENDSVNILEIDEALPTATIEAALTEWQLLVTSLTRSKKGFYEANINPQDDEHLTPEQFIQAADILEEKLGFTGQPRLIVQHEKKGRTHVHVLWQSTLIEEGKIISDSHNYRKHEEAAIEIEKTFDLEPSPRKYSQNKEEPVKHAKHDRADDEKAKRSGISLEERNALITQLYEQSKSGAAFSRALEEEGYYLARGDKATFFVVDPGHEAHLLRTCIDGAKQSEINKALYPIKAQNLLHFNDVKSDLKASVLDPKKAEAIKESFKRERQQLKANQKAEKERLEAKHVLDDYQATRERDQNKPGRFMQFLQDITGYTVRKANFQEREDREREAQQRIEVNQLEQIHRKQMKDLKRQETQEIAKLDEAFHYNPGQQPRFQVDPQERKRHETQSLVKELQNFDKEDEELQGYQERINRLWWEVKKYERNTDELNVLKADIEEQFNQFFTDGKQTLEDLHEHIEENGIRKSLGILKEQPQKFGELQQDNLTGQAYEDQQRLLGAVLVVSVRKAHYMEKRLENAKDSHELHQRSKAFFERKKLEHITNPPAERLGMMLTLQKTAKGLSDDEWKKLSTQEKFEIDNARNALKEKENMDQAKAYLKQQKELQRSQERER